MTTEVDVRALVNAVTGCLVAAKAAAERVPEERKAAAEHRMPTMRAYAEGLVDGMEEAIKHLILPLAAAAEVTVQEPEQEDPPLDLHEEAARLRDALVFADGRSVCGGYSLADLYASDSEMQGVLERAGCHPRTAAAREAVSPLNIGDQP